MKTPISDIEGTWQGDIGELSIFLDETQEGGTIAFYDYHDEGAVFFFTSYKEIDDAVEFEINTEAAYGTENYDPLMYARMMKDSTIELDTGKYQWLWCLSPPELKGVATGYFEGGWLSVFFPLGKEVMTKETFIEVHS